MSQTVYSLLNLDALQVCFEQVVTTFFKEKVLKRGSQQKKERLAYTSGQMISHTDAVLHSYNITAF